MSTHDRPEPDPGGRFPFLAGTWAGIAPLLLWALHFAFCYVGVAIGCTAILRHGASGGTTGLRMVLAIGTVAAAAGVGWMLWRGCRAIRAGDGDLMPRVRLLGALLALIAIVWTGVPLAMLPVCGSG